MQRGLDQSLRLQKLYYLPGNLAVQHSRLGQKSITFPRTALEEDGLGDQTGEDMYPSSRLGSMDERTIEASDKRLKGSE
ncbi:hypothetical protein BELL_0757g00070 [Botrytis elliptica]|uniref:Uncharacterized protein n=1 Tax=Botrytis elliptica TaxID=278938 RepID=A0A4Z1J7V5_9HELO|nr:hypothetical protein EAE99_000355 [Botrytis elliptica]TGO69795.1 hypothetical protein BELL_0757g00070 [Botrytis elliptica]